MADLYRIRTVWTGIAGTPFLTTAFFHADAGTVEQALDAMELLWVNAAEVISDQLQYDIEPAVDTIESTTGGLIRTEAGTARTGNGSQTGLLLSLGTCGLLNVNTGSVREGRQVRGKLYFPGPTNNSNADGLPGQVYGGVIGDAFDLMNAATGAEYCVWSRPQSGRIGNSFAATSASPSQYWARIRTRQR